jgi:membrane dipeptidase
MPATGAATGASEEALALHKEHPAIDLHADTPMWMRWVGYDIHAKHEPPLWRAALGGHVDAPRMREGGMGAQFFGLVSLPIARARGPARVIIEQIDLCDELIGRAGKDLRLVRSGAELDAAEADGALGAFLGIEGAHALEGDFANLERFAGRGVRYLGLLHFSANEAGFPAYGKGRSDAEGLTPWGRELVLRCGDLGVLVDLAHINRKGFLEAAALSRLPPICSHTGILGAFEHWRNIDDDQLRAVADRGGVIGVIFCPRYLGGDGLEPVVKHLKHILDVVGEDTPALGSDWDGFIIPTGPLKDPRGLPLLTEALLAAKIPPRTIGKILGDNVRRVLRDLR